MCAGDQRCGAEVATVSLVGRCSQFWGRGGGTCFPVFLFSKNERLILECVYVKYLRSLSSHIYRFISKITKNKTRSTGKWDGDGAVVDRIGRCPGTSGNVCMSGREEPSAGHSYPGCCAVMSWGCSRQGCRPAPARGLAVPHRRVDLRLH